MGFLDLDFNNEDDDLLLFDNRRRLVGHTALTPPTASLALWLKADAITGLTDGQAISSWVDSSGSGNTATQGTGANQPIYKVGIINARPVARFNAVAMGMLTTNNVFTANPMSFFVVYSGNSNAANRRAIQGNVAASDWLVGPYQNSYQTFDGLFLTDGAVSAGVFKLATFIIPATGKGSFWLNGTLIGTDNGGGHVPGTIGLGASGTSAEPLDGDLAEVLGYTVDQTSQRTVIEAYLNQKYGLF